MNRDENKPMLELPISAAVDVAVEHWRLSNWLKSTAPANDAPARHALRKIEQFLKLCEIETVTMEGRVFDPGLAVRVVDTIDDSKITAGKSIIAETLSPMIIWRDDVLRQADVIVHRGVGK